MKTIEEILQIPGIVIRSIPKKTERVSLISEEEYNKNFDKENYYKRYDLIKGGKDYITRYVCIEERTNKLGGKYLVSIAEHSNIILRVRLDSNYRRCLPRLC